MMQMSSQMTERSDLTCACLRTTAFQYTDNRQYLKQAVVVLLDSIYLVRQKEEAVQELVTTMVTSVSTVVEKKKKAFDDHTLDENKDFYATVTMIMQLADWYMEETTSAVKVLAASRFGRNVLALCIDLAYNKNSLYKAHFAEFQSHMENLKFFKDYKPQMHKLIKHSKSLHLPGLDLLPPLLRAPTVEKRSLLVALIQCGVDVNFEPRPNASPLAVAVGAVIDEDNTGNAKSLKLALENLQLLLESGSVIVRDKIHNIEVLETGKERIMVCVQLDNNSKVFVQCGKSVKVK